jgi:sugar O-acyltransferase (sialic acid O-acetyltransferase NeuD family)
VDPSDSGILVLGAGGHARVVAGLVRALGIQVVAYADLDTSKLGAAVDGEGATVALTEAAVMECVRGDRSWPCAVKAVALGIGDNGARARLFHELGAMSAPPLVHPHGWVSPTARIEAGSVVLAGAVINVDAAIGEAVIVNTGATIEHDCVLARGVHVSPGATLCGAVRVGERSWIGAGAVIIPGCVIGADCIVGAGAVVIRDVGDGCTVVGNPAHLISREPVDPSLPAFPHRVVAGQPHRAH